MTAAMPLVQATPAEPAVRAETSIAASVAQLTKVDLLEHRSLAGLTVEIDLFTHQVLPDGGSKGVHRVHAAPATNCKN